MDKTNSSIAIFMLLCFLSFIGFVSCASGTSAKDEISISEREKVAVKKLKYLVGKNLTHEYMKLDIYLVKWLRGVDLNVHVAADKIQKMLEWRKENKIDELYEEDFSFFEEEFPHNHNGFDRIGRPVGTTDIRDWDIRKIFLAGKRDLGIRYVYYLCDFAVERIFNAYRAGRNVSSGIIVYDLGGFNKYQHACPECLAMYHHVIVSMDRYYPLLVHRLIGINTPITFYSVFTGFSNLMTKQVRERMKFFGTDKTQWKPYLFNLISPDQLERNFGGTINTTDGRALDE